MSGDGERRVVRLFGAMLMVVGGLVVTLSGLCSALVIVGSVVSALTRPSPAAGLVQLAPIVLVFGGLPIGLGLVAFLVGRSFRRRPKPRPDPHLFE